MKPGARRSYGSKRPSRAYQTAALQMLLVQCDDLSRLSVESIARSHGKKPAEIEQAIEAERKRRTRAA